MTRVAVSPAVLRWARGRAGVDVAALAERFPKLPEWEEGETQPTLKQLEAFAKVVHVPFGYLMLPEPPRGPLPVPDFRTLDGRAVRRPSPNLLDTIYACQERQGWYREFAQITRQRELAFVGSAGLERESERVAADMRAALVPQIVLK